MKLAFSTLGCPEWSLSEVAEAAHRYGYAAVELRCIEGDIELASRPEFQPNRIASSRAVFRRLGIGVCCLDTSASFHSVAASERRRNVESAIRSAEIAASLGAPAIRLFPNEVPDGATRAETRLRIAESLHEVASRAPAGLRVALETHGDFATAEAAVDLVRLADHPSLAVVWDAANTVAAGEPVATSAKLVAPHLALVHLRDAKPVPGERFWHPVLAGRGEVPFETVLEELRAIGYAGYVSFEWEKYWRPELEEPEVALRDFREAIRRLDAAA